MIDDVCVARINRTTSGTWMMISNDNYSAALEGSQEVAFNWITAQSLTVALSN